MEPTQGVLLIVDDEKGSRWALRSWLERAPGLDVSCLEAGTGLEALDLLYSGAPVDVVLLDLDMPEMDGFAALQAIRDGPWSYLPVIIVTGLSDDLSVKATCNELGADAYLTKPVDRPTMVEMVPKIRALIRYRRALEAQETLENIVQTLCTAIEVRERVTGEHCGRISLWASALGRSIGAGARELEALRYASLHDVGKIGIPDAILNKPGPLTPEERQIMRRHVDLGAQICRGLRHGDLIVPMVRHHHERWDGGGYPDALLGPETPLIARIVSVVDAFDAMTGDRPYRQALPTEEAVRRLCDGAGSQWDAHLVKRFLSLLDQDPLQMVRGDPEAPYPAPRALAGELRVAVGSG